MILLKIPYYKVLLVMNANLSLAFRNWWEDGILVSSTIYKEYKIKSEQLLEGKLLLSLISEGNCSLWSS